MFILFHVELYSLLDILPLLSFQYTYSVSVIIVSFVYF